MDLSTRGIIRASLFMDPTNQSLMTGLIENELRALTSMPVPSPAIWAFVPLNDRIFASQGRKHVSPAEWVRQGSSKIAEALAE